MLMVGAIRPKFDKSLNLQQKSSQKTFVLYIDMLAIFENICRLAKLSSNIIYLKNK